MMYNILWMDDDFIGPDYSKGEDLVSFRRESFLDDVAMAKEFDLNIEPALNIDEFKTKFTPNPEKFQAVILDIMDLNPEDTSDESASPQAIRLAEKANIPIYVYSNNPDKPGHKDYLKTCLPKGHIISKAGDVRKCLYSKIVQDLDPENSCFNGHEECLELLNKEYLSTRTQMKSILKNIDDETYLPFNDMRQVLENMLETMVQSGIIPAQTNDSDVYNTFNKRMDYLTKKCRTLPNDKVDWNNPIIPYSDCRHEIKWVLNFMGNITNRYSHYQNANPSFLLNGDLLLTYSKLIREMTYDGFFVSMKWFNGYMNTKSKAIGS